MRWLEAELPDAVAAFSTRIGGVSEPPFDTLNLGIATGDDRGRVRQNRGRVADAGRGGSADVILAGRQIHGAEVVRHDRAPSPIGFAVAAGLGVADRQATGPAGVRPGVFVADCLQVALAGAGG